MAVVFLFWIVLGYLGIALVFGLLIYQAIALKADRTLLALTRPADMTHLPQVTVLIPARNEARNIIPCLASVAQLDYPHLEIIVADDASTDDTSALVQQWIAAHPQLNVRLVTTPSDPQAREDWVSGKGYVLWQAAQQAEGDWLLLVDADTRQRPDSVWRAMLFAQQQGLKALSCSGIYPNPGFWGEVLEGLLYVAIFLSIPLRQIHDPSQPHGWLNGQFIAIERATYLRVDGHHAIRHYSFDDLSMAYHLKQQQVPFRFLPAAQAYTCLNYVNLAEAWQAWVRQIAGGTPWLGIGKLYFGVSTLVMAAVGFIPWLLLGVGPLLPGWWEPIWGNLTLSHLLLGQIVGAIGLAAINRASMKLSLWRSLLLPVATVMVLMVYWQAYQIRFGGKPYHWRGRVFALDQPPGT